MNKTIKIILAIFIAIIIFLGGAVYGARISNPNISLGPSTINGISCGSPNIDLNYEYANGIRYCCTNDIIDCGGGIHGFICRMVRTEGPYYHWTSCGISR
ncbi:MAG: hypothetical protein ABIG28_03050 [archaeon]